MPRSRNQTFLDAVAQILGGGSRSSAQIRSFVDRYGPLHAFPMYQYAAPPGSNARRVWESTWEAYNRAAGWEAEQARLSAELRRLSPEDADYPRLMQERDQAEANSNAARSNMEAAHSQGGSSVVESVNEEVQREVNRQMQPEEVRAGPQMTQEMADYYNGRPNVQYTQMDVEQYRVYSESSQAEPAQGSQAGQAQSSQSTRQQRHSKSGKSQGSKSHRSRRH
ncbi:hypothetical protein JDV02_008122 [Purpureocillium takamizusanense]|uniref:Uncharacterized protein n=1 Tax=Purpureocillium takamizusanense TaxID=2060973 RepID=A0A9Q8QLI2_9HYPO|nr:uncharacterized protein JDV02_008122 [Purpureocillium takamizusanense]UNI22213.1 hypothetical protein JDV02_008122 [Purpureocillium takamizusanense]